MKKLFACDWDYTIVGGHTHNTIIKKKAANPNDPEYVNGDWNTVKDIPILGSAAEWKKFFESAIQQDHYVAIVSFNGFKNNIPLFLENINLDKKVIEKIDIIAELPEDPKSANKNEYIQRAIANAKKEGFSGQPENVYLIDDSRKNIEAAQQAGYQVIHAKKDGSHLIELQNKLEELKKLEEKPPVVDRRNKPKYLKQDQETSRSEEIKQQIEALESQRIEDIKTINQLKNNKSLSPQEKSTLDSLQLELNGIDLAIKAKSDYLKEEKEKLAGPVVDSNKPKHIESIPKSTEEEQGAVSTEVTKQSSQSTLPRQKLNFYELMEAKKKEVIEFWKTPLEELNKTPTTVKQSQQTSNTSSADDCKLKKESLEELLKAKPKKAELLKNSTGGQGAASAKNPEFIKELNETLAKQALQGPSTFFGSGNSSSDKTKKPILMPKQLSR